MPMDDEAAWPARRPELRASDLDRDRIMDLLVRHQAEGRLAMFVLLNLFLVAIWAAGDRDG